MPTGDFLRSVRHLPDQLRDIAVSAADLDGLPSADRVASVVILGTGGARVGGDALEAICELTATVPIVATGARCPAWVSSSTLAIAVSRSGDDAGVVAAADTARRQGAALVVITSGGALADAAEGWDVPVLPVDPVVGPAAGLGVTIVPVLVLLERLGVVSGMTRTVSEAADRLGTRMDQLLHDPTVRALATALPGRVALVTAAGSIGKHAARRWVQELDRYGGVAAVRRRLPTGPTDVETGKRLDDATGRGAVLVMLRHADEPPGLDGGVALAREQFTEVFEIQAEGEGPLAQLLDLVLVADAVAAVLIGDVAD